MQPTLHEKIRTIVCVIILVFTILNTVHFYIDDINVFIGHLSATKDKDDQISKT